MRAIKFRGKSTESNQWVFGNFNQTENGHLLSHVPQYWENSEIIGNIYDNPELLPFS